MAAHDLHGAIGPAIALLLEVDERVRHQTASIAVGQVSGLIASLEHAQSQFGIFGDAPLGPAAQSVQQTAAHQRHGAVLDDGVALVTRDHADMEKAAVLGIAHGLEGVLVLITIVLRRLHNGHLRIDKRRHQIAQPVVLDNVVSVDASDDLGIGGGVPQGKVERPCLKAI